MIMRFGSEVPRLKRPSRVRDSAGFPERLHSSSGIYGSFLSILVVIMLSFLLLLLSSLCSALAGASLPGGNVTWLPN